MTRNWIVASAALVVFLVVVLFEVDFNPVFSLPRTVERLDARQAARFEQCVSERTDQATRDALHAADNPDVQTLMIRMRQKDAIAGCRERFPELRVTVQLPLRINLIDLEWRF
jgi:hypothetical protein